MRKAFPWSRRSSEPEEITLTGQRIILREKRIEDAPRDYAWRSDDELARLDATRPLRMAYKDFQKYSEEELSFPNPRSHRFAIDTLDGTHIGNCMYYDIDTRSGEAELGIMIGDREYWGKGYGTDSLLTFLDHVFTATALTRIYLHTLEWNNRARRAFTKAGFRDVKKVRRSGMDFILMEAWRSEWERRKIFAQPAQSDQPALSSDQSDQQGTVERGLDGAGDAEAGLTTRDTSHKTEE